MKNFFKAILIAVLVFAVLCGCADDTSTTDVVSGIPEGPWERNLEEHWKTDGTGEIVYSGEHETGDDRVCDVCESEIIDWGNGNCDVYSYDGYGNITKSTSYKNGEMVSESVYEYFYNDYGNVLFSKCYENSVLTEECTYSVNTEGYSVLQETKTYFEDGLYTEIKYNENGEVYEERTCSADGILYFYGTREYAFGDDGSSYLFKLNESDQIKEKEYEYIYNEQGDCVSYTEYDFYKMVLYTETTEYDYFENGWKSYKFTKVNGLPSEEIYFGIFEDGEGGSWTYYEKQTVYGEDGSYTVCEYNEYDELLSKTAFDANGNKI